MPKTTISVLFSGKDGGLSSLFSKIDAEATKLASSMDKLDNALKRVDNTLQSIKSRGNVLSNISSIKIPQLSSQITPRTEQSGGSSAMNVLSGIGNRMYSSFASGGAKMMSTLSSIGSFTTSTFSRVSSIVTGAISGAYKNVTGFIQYTDKAIMMFGNSIRQIAQGIQSFGIAFSIFVSAPIAKILQGVVSEAVNFDDAMNSVQKVTGATNDEIASLSESLSQSSLMLVNTREELAQYAEEWGALGVTISSASDAAMMSGLVEWTSKLVMSAEDLTADEVVEKLGKAIILYFGDITEFDKVKDGIGSVILALEDANSVGAGDILSTFQRMAPIAQQMGIDMVGALTLSASAAAGIASAERAGTELAAALQKISINTDKASAATGINKDKLQEMIDTDAEGYILSLAYSISKMSSNVDQQAALYEQFGVTGGKAIAALVSSWGNLEKNIKISNEAFLEGTYIQVQYQQSLESSKVQLQLLRNNITYAGSAIGDALLPYITKFVTLAIPAIQMATTWFKSLGEEVKLQVAGWALLLAIGGPIVVFFSSMLFMIGLTISGLSSMFGVVMMVLQGLVGFTGAVYALLSPWNLLAAAIVGLAIYSTYLLADLQNAEGVVNTYVSKFFDWGYNLIMSFSEGIRSAASAAYNAVMSVINAFIGLIQSFSPPKEGPLKNIDKWGKGVIGAFADGIRSGAGEARNAVSYINESLKSILTGFSPETVNTFSGLFNMIKSTVSAVGAHIGIDTQAINNRIETSANALAAFIQGLQSGIPTSFQEVADMLGGLGGDFESLIKLQLRYTEGESRLKAIESALKGINAETDTMIDKIVQQSDLTADQQTAMIRRIKLEQAMKADALSAEQAALQAEQEGIKSDIDKKQEIINILSGLINPMENAASGGYDKVDKPEKPPKPDDITPIDYTQFEQASGSLDKVSEKFNKASESASTFTEKLGNAKLVIEGFIAAIRGDSKEDYAAKGESFWKGWEKGADIREKVLVFMDKFNGFLLQIQGYKQIINDGFLAFIMGYETAGSGGTLNWDTITFLGLFSGALAVLGFVAGIAKIQLDEAYNAIFSRKVDGEKTPFEIAIDRIIEAAKSFKRGWDSEIKAIDFDGLWRSLKRIGGAIVDMGVVLGFAATDATGWEVIGHVLGGIVMAATKFVTAIDGIIQVVRILSGAGSKKDFEEMYQSFYKGVKPANDLKKEADGLYESFSKIGEGVRDAIKYVTDWKNYLTGTSEPTYDTSETNAGGGGGGGFGGAMDSAKDMATTSGTTIGESLVKSVIDALGITSVANTALAVQKYVDDSVNQADPKVTESGTAVGNTVTKAVIDALGITAVANGAIAIGKYIEDARKGSDTPVDTSGKTLGQKFIDGFHSFLNDPLPYITVMGAMPIQIEAWRSTTGQPLLDANGRTISGDIITGADSKLSEDVSYLGTMVTAITTWITDNVKTIGDMGISLGTNLIKGITDALSGSGSAMWEALKKPLQNLLDSLPEWFKILVGLQDDPTKEEKKGKSVDGEKNSGNSTTESTTQGRPPERSSLLEKGALPLLSNNGTDGIMPVNITINIDNGGGKMDKNNIDYLVERIYSRLVTDMRLART